MGGPKLRLHSPARLRRFRRRRVLILSCERAYRTASRNHLQQVVPPGQLTTPADHVVCRHRIAGRQIDRERVELATVLQHLVVEVRASREATHPHVADHIALMHPGTRGSHHHETGSGGHTGSPTHSGAGSLRCCRNCPLTRGGRPLRPRSPSPACLGSAA